MVQCEIALERACTSIIKQALLEQIGYLLVLDSTRRFVESWSPLVNVERALEVLVVLQFLLGLVDRRLADRPIVICAWLCSRFSLHFGHHG